MMTVNVQHIQLGQFGKVGDKEVNDTDFPDPVPHKVFPCAMSVDTFALESCEYLSLIANAMRKRITSSVNQPTILQMWTQLSGNTLVLHCKLLEKVFSQPSVKQIFCQNLNILSPANMNNFLYVSLLMFRVCL